MKKIILTIGIMMASFGINLSYAQNSNIGNYQINNSLQEKIDNVLNKFYLKLEKKYNLENRTKKLIRINKKIDKILPTIHNTTIINVLKYLEYKISQKIHFYMRETYGSFKREQKYNINNTRNQGIITPVEYQKILGLGIDVNWVNFPKEIKTYSSKWPQDFKAKGFDNVRIRFGEDVDLNHLKKVVDDSLKAGLIPVVAFGAKEFKNNPDEEHLEKAVQIWKQVAEVLKDESYKVSFDLMIEPGKNLKKSPEMLYKYYETIVPIIRNTGGNNKNRIIFLAPNHLADPEYLKDLTPIFQKLNDKYLMAEFHFLAAGPFRKTNSTGKRLTWNGTGTIEERQKIEDRIKIAYDWQKQTGIKIWFGAWMPGNYNHTNDGGNNNYSISEQISFSSYFESLLKKYQIPNDINADQQFYNIKNNTWRTDRSKVIEAIITSWKK